MSEKFVTPPIVFILEEQLERKDRMLAVAQEALRKIKYEPLDDKTTIRFIESLKMWRGRVCSVSFDALTRMEEIENEHKGE